MKDPEFKKKYDKEYKEFAFSEFLLALASGEDSKSVRKMAEEVGLHANTIQNLKSGKTKNIMFKTLNTIVEACGFHIEFVKGEERVPLSDFLNPLEKTDSKESYEVVNPYSEV